MSIWPHAEVDQIHTRKLTRAQMKVHAQLIFVESGGSSRVQLRMDTMNLRRAERQFIEQCLACHAEVAVGVIGSDRTVVAPIELHPRPIHLIAVWRRGQQMMERLRC